MTRVSPLLRTVQRYATSKHLRSLTTIRRSSTSITQAELEQKLLSRQPHIIHDYVSPTPSHLLNLSLADYLPPACHPHNFELATAHLPGRFDETPLPQGHHLIYFSAQLPGSQLLPDGTDTLHSPGVPFHRRMWGGGSILFNTEKKYSLDLDGTRAVCLEKITDVKVKGRQGDEKVFVGLERKIGMIGRKLSDRAHDGYDEEWPLNMEDRLKALESVSGGEEAGGMDGLAVVERRELVFMRQRDVGEEIKAGRIVKPPHEPDYTITLAPSPSLLFRFSALSFNAHQIHLNPQYCREVEGYRNMLVHGPLTVVMMLSVLRAQLAPGEMVMKFDYRNLAPLFVGEEMKICLKKDKFGHNRWDVWIVGKEGGYAAKGSAQIAMIDSVRE